MLSVIGPEFLDLMRYRDQKKMHTIYYLRSDVGVTVVIFRIFLPQCTIVTMQCFLFHIQYVGISAKAPHFLRLI